MKALLFRYLWLVRAGTYVCNLTSCNVHHPTKGKELYTSKWAILSTELTSSPNTSVMLSQWCYVRFCCLEAHWICRISVWRYWKTWLWLTTGELGNELNLAATGLGAGNFSNHAYVLPNTFFVPLLETESILVLTGPSGSPPIRDSPRYRVHGRV